MNILSIQHLQLELEDQTLQLVRINFKLFNIWILQFILTYYQAY